jgi:hypothetical protein
MKIKGFKSVAEWKKDAESRIPKLSTLDIITRHKIFDEVKYFFEASGYDLSKFDHSDFDLYLSGRMDIDEFQSYLVVPK